MSTTFRFVDAADRTARPKWENVIAESDLRFIESHNHKNAQLLEITQAIACVRTLKNKEKYWVIGGVEDFSTTTKVRDNEGPIEEHEIRKTWVDIDNLVQSMKTLKNYSKVHQLRREVNDLSVKRIKRLIQKMDNGLVRIADVSAVSEFARAEAYALFVAHENIYTHKMIEGYLGHGGISLVPLQRARMFDSEIAVQKFLKGHYFLNNFPSIQVVKIQLNMVALTTAYSGSGRGTDRLNDSRIQQAAAFIQKENMEQALLDASKERLLERVKELDDTPPPEPAAQQKRRM